jgi:UDP-glucose 4-epimerase
MPLFSFNPCSVLDLLKAMEKACGRTIPYKIGPRRAGDVASLFANPDQAKVCLGSILSGRYYLIIFLNDLLQLLLGWEAKRELQDMADDLWRWQHQNPEGFQSSS